MGPILSTPQFGSTLQLDLAAARQLNSKAPATANVPEKQSATTISDDSEERKLFDQFIAGNFFKQMLAAMRKTQEKPAYFHGGKMEAMIQETFLDPALAESIAKSSAASFTDPMYELFRKR